MAAYTVGNISRAGVEQALAAVAASDTFANDGRTLLVVANGSGGGVDVTVDLSVDPNASEPLAETAATAITVPAGETHIFGPFPVGRFGSVVTVNFSATTTITAGAFRLPAA